MPAGVLRGCPLPTRPAGLPLSACSGTFMRKVTMTQEKEAALGSWQGLTNGPWNSAGLQQWYLQGSCRARAGACCLFEVTME